VIDNDHWRHLFLLYGLLWGIVAADKLWKRDIRTAIAAGSVPAIERAPAIPRPAFVALTSDGVPRASPVASRGVSGPFRTASATVPRWVAPTR
jgi:hypothetical protein